MYIYFWANSDHILLFRIIKTGGPDAHIDRKLNKLNYLKNMNAIFIQKNFFL